MRNFEDKIFNNWQILKLIVEKYRFVGKVIGFTNGCFDIVHKGHVLYLYQAKNYCDILVVGINTDESIKRIKGKNKPINSLENRIIVLASLEPVDFVVPFSEDNATDLLEYLKPDIYFKGGDYKDKRIPEFDIVEKYRITYKTLIMVPDISTTKIISIIKEL
jgi:D-beta-D-heptose 7-phosphate kinase/D-beta-D-heptose 1-phosphate adenosyltransferase